MKILKLAILISFLFNSVAYPYENASNTLRPPMLGDKTNKERLESAGKLASGQIIKEKFSLQDYRPGWTFEGWGTAKSAIKENITTTKGRKEALKLVRTLARKLAENKIYPNRTLQYAIPAVAKVARNADEFELFINLGIKLAENKIDPDQILRYAIPAVAKVARNADEFELFINLGIKLAENKIHPGDTLENAIPAVVKVAKTPQELKDMCDSLLNLNIKLASGHNIGNNPTANLSVLELTPTLFLDTEVAANPDAFKQGLAQLKSNEGNIPVVLLTEETKESIVAKLSGIDLTGVQFRTKAELGLQDLEWGKDERVSLIDGIDNLKCIPLTKALCETYKDLQKVRDQV